jgi:hypothetical protein
MPRNPDSPIAGGTNADPEFRKLRGRYGAEKRESLERHIDKIVDAAPHLTVEQRDRLETLFRGDAA